ncbi:unnamed protein product, partial [Rotaria sordida]
NPKSQRELDNAVDEGLNGLSLNVIQIFICIINIYTYTIHTYPRKFLLTINSIF